jgi:hypothetical protein
MIPIPFNLPLIEPSFVDTLPVPFATIFSILPPPAFLIVINTPTTNQQSTLSSLDDFLNLFISNLTPFFRVSHLIRHHQTQQQYISQPQYLSILTQQQLFSNIYIVMTVGLFIILLLIYYLSF